MSNSLERRIAEHKAGDVPGFTKKHGVDRLIDEGNPHWADIYPDMMAPGPLHLDLAAALGADRSRSDPET